MAMSIARAKIEEQLANRANYSNIVSVPSGTLTLAQDGINGLYKIDVSNPVFSGTPVADLKDITVYVCWRARGGRIIGSCINSGNALIWDPSVNPPSSPCKISTSIAHR